MTNIFFDDPEEDFSDDNFSSDFDDDQFIDDNSEEFLDPGEENSEHDHFDAIEEHPLHPNDVDHPDIGFGHGKERVPIEASSSIDKAFLSENPTELLEKSGTEETAEEGPSAFVSFIRDIFKLKS